MIKTMIEAVGRIEKELDFKGEIPSEVILVLLLLEEQEEDWTREMSEQLLTYSLSAKKSGGTPADIDIAEEMFARALKYEAILY